jgi:hypothetical protein
MDELVGLILIALLAFVGGFAIGFTLRGLLS